MIDFSLNAHIEVSKEMAGKSENFKDPLRTLSAIFGDLSFFLSANVYKKKSET